MEVESRPATEAPAAEFDGYDQSYTQTVNQALAFSGLSIDFFTRVKVEYFVGLIGSLRPPADRADVIDIGCGIGTSHPLLAGRVRTLVGVDVSGPCIAQAIQLNPHNEYKVFDGRAVPYADRSFDAASAVCVFHHVPVAERLELAVNVRRVLRPAGIFAIFEHNPLNPLTVYAISRCEFDANAILLRNRESESLLREAGFTGVETRFILTVPAKGSLLRGIDRLFAGLPFGAQYFTFGRA
jgi:SAM-dependent methyltransferase